MTDLDKLISILNTKDLTPKISKIEVMYYINGWSAFWAICFVMFICLGYVALAIISFGLLSISIIKLMFHINSKKNYQDVMHIRYKDHIIKSMPTYLTEYLLKAKLQHLPNDVDLDIIYREDRYQLSILSSVYNYEAFVYCDPFQNL